MGSGLYNVKAYAVSPRMRETDTRIALSAQPPGNPRLDIFNSIALPA